MIKDKSVMEFKFQNTELGQFLHQELAISTSELILVTQRAKQLHAPLPMLLWEYGLITLEQLQRIFDWLGERPLVYLPVEIELE
jgi:hypothetical protein